MVRVRAAGVEWEWLRRLWKAQEGRRVGDRGPGGSWCIMGVSGQSQGAAEGGGLGVGSGAAGLARVEMTGKGGGKRGA